jgi:deoxyribodipyrimidine photolyase-related protein
MGTYGAGDLMTTKPYVAGSAYIARMSDYCDHCAFDPASTCPITPLYWAFLARHEAVLSTNARMRVAIASVRRRPDRQKARDRATFEHVSAALAAGRRMTPEELNEPPGSLDGAGL